MYKNYKYYDKKGRRLAVYLQRYDDNNATIVVITCSKEDKFSKQFADKQFEIFMSNRKAADVNPQSFIIEDVKVGGEVKALNNFCYNNFYKAVERGIITKCYKTFYINANK